MNQPNDNRYWRRPDGFVSPYPEGHPCHGRPLHTHTTDKATRQCAAQLRRMLKDVQA